MSVFTWPPIFRPANTNLRCKRVGFAKLVLSGIVLRVGQVATIDVRLTMKTREGIVNLGTELKD
jgi:hypothetical protein